MWNPQKRFACADKEKLDRWKTEAIAYSWDTPLRKAIERTGHIAVWRIKLICNVIEMRIKPEILVKYTEGLKGEQKQAIYI